MADIVFEVRGRVGTILLNRPDALNALTLDMCIEMDKRLRDWESDLLIEEVMIHGAGNKAFCAGGDIRKLYEEGRAGSRYPRDFYRAEYRLDARVKHFEKPYIAVMNGIVMGGGVGVSINGAVRVATENMVFAMPETGIGLFPDVGGSYFLSRCPGAIGMYLGLTGARLRAPDAIYCGIADKYVRSRNLGALTDLESVEKQAESPGDAPLARNRAMIDRCFGKDSVEKILAALDAERGTFAAETLAALATKSPTSLKLTHRQIRAGGALVFDDCMRMEWRMVNRVIEGHDFYEGTRAAVIDKDRKPRWRPESLAQITDKEVASYFAPLDGDELHFDWEKRK